MDAEERKDKGMSCHHLKADAGDLSVSGLKSYIEKRARLKLFSSLMSYLTVAEKLIQTKVHGRCYSENCVFHLLNMI